MKCVKVVTTEDGGSRFVDVDIEQTAAPVVPGVPSLLVSPPALVHEVVFVTMPTDVRSTEPHHAPNRQFAIVVDGEVEIETSDGERRTFSPGAFVLVEDTAGSGHVTRVLKSPASLMWVSLADS